VESSGVMAALRRWWWVVLAITLLGAAAGAVPSPAKSVAASTTYSATHTLLVADSSDPNNASGGYAIFNQIPLFATTGEVPKRAAARLAFDGEPAELAAQVSVSVQGDTGAVLVSTSQDDAAAAVGIADAFAEELAGYLAERQDTLRSQRLAAALAEVEALESDIEQLQASAAANPDDEVVRGQLDALTRQYSSVYEQYRLLQQDTGLLQLTTLEKAAAIAVTSPGLSAPTSRSGRSMLGGILGAAVGLGLALFLARTDRKIRDRSAAEQIVGTRSQATIPTSLDPQVAVVVRPDRHEPVADAYRILRSVVSFSEGGAAKAQGRAMRIVVISAGSGDGKTSVVSNLSAAFAESGVPTLAVNTDFRRPALARRLLGRRMVPLGLDIDDLQRLPVEVLLTPTPIDGLTLFDLADNVASPGDLARLAAARLPSLSEGHEGVLVVDTSPVGATAEVLEVVPVADVVVLVVRLGHTLASSLRTTVDTVRSVSRAPLILVVLGDKAGEGYQYGYASVPGRTVKYRYAAQAKGAGRDDSKRLRRPAIVDDVDDEVDPVDAAPPFDQLR